VPRSPIISVMIARMKPIAASQSKSPASGTNQTLVPRSQGDFRIEAVRAAPRETRGAGPEAKLRAPSAARIPMPFETASDAVSVGQPFMHSL